MFESFLSSSGRAGAPPNNTDDLSSFPLLHSSNNDDVDTQLDRRNDTNEKNSNSNMSKEDCNDKILVKIKSNDVGEIEVEITPDETVDQLRYGTANGN